ncbi:unnamed protein product [Didymodactylos carnosus]|uniref:Transmembrane protein 163 n=1 Tax=Didymodactylos carnosus TaxID=1234261 RepID=A0A814M7L3_9BILA|nr:unnamed protein product [Didymodactylos carnosus]CAF1240278.1 unnamed protein product [Didymodactylos carnosus]CAF3839801.1 unnamed protein product [Didymodactylos carnosus]CAF4047707.1 unnamed protein product [Didymodactylos carnosus]
MSTIDDDDDDVPLFDQPIISLHNSKLSLIPFDDSTDSTDVQLIDINEKKKSRSRRGLIILNIISIILAIGCGAITFYLAIQDQSASALSFAINLCLDVLAYAAIIWRFKNTHSDNAGQELFTLRILGILFILSGCGCLINSIIDILKQNKPKPDLISIIIASIETTLFLLLGLAKIILAETLNYTSAYADAFNTTISSIMAFCVTLSIIIYKYINTNVWYIDPVFGTVISIIILCYGLWMLIKSFNKH